jgi:gliding motility-associated-like protein
MQPRLLNIQLTLVTILLMVCCCFSRLAAQSCAINTFQKHYGNNDNVLAAYIMQTPEGGYLATGQSASTLSSTFLLKLDSVGNTSWFREFEATAGLYGGFKKIIRTSDGNYLALGRSYIPPNYLQVWLVKFDDNGQILWNNNYPYPSGISNDGLDIIETSDGGYAIAGAENSASNGANAMLMKVSPVGNFQWCSALPPSTSLFGITENNGYLFGVGSNGYNGIIVKVKTSDGSFAAARSINLYNKATTLYQIVKKNERFYINTKTTDGQYSSTNLQQNFVVLDTNMSVLKAYKVDVNDPELGYLIHMFPSQSGSFTSSVDFGNNTADFFFFRVSYDGVVEWKRRYVRPWQQNIYCISPTSDDGLIALGYDNDSPSRMYAVKTDAQGLTQGCTASDQPVTISAANYTIDPLVTNFHNVTFVRQPLTLNFNIATLPTIVQCQSTSTSAITPSVSISLINNNGVCSGQPLTFAAVAVNGGSNPQYQWKVNGVNAGTNSSTFTSTLLNNADNITCQLISNAACSIAPTASSNSITAIIKPQVTASVSIVASVTTICPGNIVNFIAMPVNEGNQPYYKWKINGAVVSTGSKTFSTSSLNNGDIIICELTSNATCVSNPITVSNSVTITVSSTTAPSIAITSSANGRFCSGTNVVFSATVQNALASANYQWYLNNIPMGSNQPQFAANTFTDKDSVKCVLTSSSSCGSTSIAESNVIKLSVMSQVTPSVSIRASKDSSCERESVSFTAQTVNAGNPDFEWSVNTLPSGANTNTYSSARLGNGDVIVCKIVAKNVLCTTAPEAVSNTIVTVVHPLPLLTLSPAAPQINNNTPDSIQLMVSTNPPASLKWQPNNYISSDTSANPLVWPPQNFSYVVTATSAVGCKNVLPVSLVVSKKLIIPNVFSPNADGINDTWIINGLFNYHNAVVEVFSRHGERLFRSVGYRKPWDGTYRGNPLLVGTYYFMIDLRDGKTKYSGTITIIR